MLGEEVKASGIFLGRTSRAMRIGERTYPAANVPKTISRSVRLVKLH
jgi:hypothetical protein